MATPDELIHVVSARWFAIPENKARRVLRECPTADALDRIGIERRTSASATASSCRELRRKTSHQLGHALYALLSELGMSVIRLFGSLFVAS